MNPNNNPAMIIIGLANTDMTVSYDANRAALDKIQYSVGAYNPLSADDFRVLLASLKQPAISQGGSGANTARDMAAYGFDVGFMGAVGGYMDDGVGKADTYGQLFIKNLDDLKIRSFVEIVPNADSRVCIIMNHDDGERTMFGQKNALYKIDSGLIARLPQTKYIMVEGNLIPENKGLMPAVRQTGSTVVLTLSGMDRDGMKHPDVLESIERANILFCNELEYEIIKTNSVKFPKICIRTLGAKGCKIFMDNKWQTFATQKINKSEIKNGTIGAGDAFTAGAMIGFINGYRAPEIAKSGNGLAARVLTSNMSYLIQR